MNAIETLDETDNAKATATNGGLPNDAKDLSGNGFDYKFKDRPKYRSQGTSLGNKLLIAMPILHVIITLSFVIGSYFYADDKYGSSFMEKGHDVPFISELGDKQPQSSLFTFGMVVTAFISLSIVITRYFQVKHFFVKYDGRLNIASLIVGVGFVFGKILCSCFQAASQREVHFVGAGIYVILACVYAGIQTFITFKNRMLFGRKETIIIALRMFFTLGMTIGTVLFLIFLHPDLVKYNKSGKSVSQGAEWFFAVCKMLFMLTFVSDFWYLHPRWLLIKPNNEALSDLVLSNFAAENGSRTSVRNENSTAKVSGLTAISE